MIKKEKNTLNNKGIAAISLIFIIVIIAIILVLAVFAFKNLHSNKENNIKENEKISSGKNDNSISTIKLNVGDKEEITGGELLSINNYKIFIPSQLIEIGYDITTEDNALKINSKDNSYKCVLVQLSDNYVMPTEEEIDALYNTPEYKKIENEDYNFDDETYDLHVEKEEQVSANYFKSLGYTAQNSPNYALTSKELNSIVGKYYLDGEYYLEGEIKNSGHSGLFPGYKYDNYYDWGKSTLFTIPKYYKDSQFGEQTSKLSVCLYLFEYYDSSNVHFNIDLWTNEL